MATPRKRATRGKTGNVRTGSTQDVTTGKGRGGDRGRRGPSTDKLPPNENIRKDADEIYGDTEIPARKGSTSQH
jgi:hypothetical protein